MDIIVENEKKENKTLNTFQKLLEQISQSPQLSTVRAVRARVAEKMFMRKLGTKNYCNCQSLINATGYMRGTLLFLLIKK